VNSILGNIVQSYFHQDWMQEFSSIDEVVVDIIKSNSEKHVAGLIEELEQLLETTHSNEELSAVLEQLGCEYIPDLSTDWVLGLLTLLKDKQRNTG
jgi:RecJ-like exonuclease